MTRVRSLSNHPYGGAMRVKGAEYEIDDADLDLLVTLRRVSRISPPTKNDARVYETRELQASTPNPLPQERPRRDVRRQTSNMRPTDWREPPASSSDDEK